MSMRDTAAPLAPARMEAPARPFMVILCSEDFFGASLVAQWDAAIVLQTAGGARAVSDRFLRSEVEYALLHATVRHVIVLAHSGCLHEHKHRGPDGDEDLRATWQRFRQHDALRALLQRHGARLHLLCTDAAARTITSLCSNDRHLRAFTRFDIDDLLGSAGQTEWSP